MANLYGVRIKAAPKVGAIYWCDFHPESVIHLPEFWKKRPVIVVSRNAPLRGKVTVLPCTTDEDNAKNPAAIELSAEVQAKIDHKRTWVVCDHLTTVATSRLDNVAKSPPRVRGDELTAILQKAHAVIAGWPPEMKVRDTETTLVVETRSATITEVMETLTIEIERKPST